MLKVHSEPPKPKPVSGIPTLLALGFRPFFILAGLSALVLLTIWLGAWAGAFPLPEYYGVIGWHSHEMLFGYSTAVIAGFLLTAVRNWTGVNTPSGKPLGLLVYEVSGLVPGRPITGYVTGLDRFPLCELCRRSLLPQRQPPFSRLSHKFGPCLSLLLCLFQHELLLGGLLLQKLLLHEPLIRQPQHRSLLHGWRHQLQTRAAIRQECCRG